MTNLTKCFCWMAAALMISSCSSGGSDGGVNQGVAVDPYVVGAVFHEVAADGTVLQPQSSPSDEHGVFTFPESLSAGSVVEMKATGRGRHGGAPFTGLLSRRIGTDESLSVAVTPLTTMVAYGVSAAEALTVLNGAGFSGVTADDLYRNPMTGLVNRTDPVADQELQLLQAAMAMEAYMEVTGNFRPSSGDLTDPSQIQIIDDLAAAVRSELSGSEFSRIVAILANDPQVTGPVILDDLILAVVQEQETLISLIRDHMATGPYDTAMVDQIVQNDLLLAPGVVKQQYLNRTMPQTPQLDGAALYADFCAGCHGPLAATDKPGRIAAQIQAAIDGNVGGMGILRALNADQVQAIADALPSVVPNIDGAALYADNCSGCHGALAISSKIGRTASQIQAAIAGNTGGMGVLFYLTPAQVQAIADALAQGSPSPGDCTSCHGQPPAGNTFPNVAGAHAVHAALPSVNNDCATCHTGADHNGTIDLAIAAAYNAKSGTATPAAGTCSNVSCHGGQTTPDWLTGKIAVATQCASCHASGSDQYNSYFSGKHLIHVTRYSCTECHNTVKLATGHFTGLATGGFEQDPATTLGGGSTNIDFYIPSQTRATSGSCFPKCHPSRNW